MKLSAFCFMLFLFTIFLWFYVVFFFCFYFVFILAVLWQCHIIQLEYLVNDICVCAPKRAYGLSGCRIEVWSVHFSSSSLGLFFLVVCLCIHSNSRQLFAYFSLMWTCCLFYIFVHFFGFCFWREFHDFHCISTLCSALDISTVFMCFNFYLNIITSINHDSFSSWFSVASTTCWLLAVIY